MDIQKLIQDAERADAVAALMQDVNPRHVLELAEKLKEAASKLAELAKQEPVAWAYTECEPDWGGTWLHIEKVDTERPQESYTVRDIKPLFTRAAPPAQLVGGRTMPRHEFAQMVNELRDVPAVQSKREKIVSILHAFNINPAGGSVADE